MKSDIDTIFLIIIFRDEFIRSVEIARDNESFFVVGRDLANDISLEFDELVSRRHCSVKISAQGILIRDMDSRNGIYYNNERQHQFIMPLEDSFILGDTKIIISASSYHAVEKTQVIDDLDALVSVSDFKRPFVYQVVDYILHIARENAKDTREQITKSLVTLIEDLFPSADVKLVTKGGLIKTSGNIDEKVLKVLTKQEAVILKESESCNSLHPVRVIFPFYKTARTEAALVLDLDSEITQNDFSLLYTTVYFSGLIIKEREDIRNLSRKLDLAENTNRQTRIIGMHDCVKTMHSMIERIASVPSIVLVTGESGTGKELVARNIHELSPRSEGPFVAVNCASIPEMLIESELFGHVKGAFTGADSNRTGKIEMAEGGTLFLDEIGEMSLDLQGRLLRFLEEGEIQKVGSDKVSYVDVRIVAATNRNLENDVVSGYFRKDLFFRLSVIRINTPPLRERLSDIKVLANYFIEYFNEHLGKKIEGISDEALLFLEKYSWPGNIRELRNVLERACVLTTNNHIEKNDLSLFFADGENFANSEQGDIIFPDKVLSLAEVENEYIHHVLNLNNGNKQKTAQDLGITRKTLYARLKDI